MNIEASRLRTFKNWPANAVVDARRIAKAGFYYMGQGLEVQCFSCGGRISEWNYGDKVMTRHRWLDPRCPFVVNPTSSGNVPIEGVLGNSSSNVSSSPPVSDRTDSVHSPSATPRSLPQPPSPSPPPPVRRTNSVLAISRNLRVLYQQNELARLNSFEDWPKPYIVTPESLARAGFYYTRDGDTVKCAFCDLMVGHWEEGDDPFTEHIRHYPSCSFLISNGSVPPSTNTPEPVDFPPPGVNMRTPTSEGENVTVRELGVQFHKVPKHPKYSMHDSRLQTFVNWPGDVVQTPEDLAAAGFYYAGSGDQVKCFHCDGGLRMWDPQDDPWIEHARWYPQCGYIVLVKGQSFIDNVLQHYPPLEQEELDQIERDNGSNNKSSSAHPPRPHVPVSEAQLQELMSSPEAVAALQVGLEVSRVRTALKQRAEMGGNRFNSPEALINAALDVQLEETPELDHYEAWGTPPSSPVNPWRRSRYNNEHLISDQTQSENTSDGNTTETEDVAEYPPRISDNQHTAPVESTTDEEDNNIGVINNEPANYQLPASEDADEADRSLSTQTSEEEVKQKVSLEEENRRLKEARLCKICMDKEISVVFLPCGHLVTCVHCAHSLADCPVCREEIKATVRTFLS